MTSIHTIAAKLSELSELRVAADLTRADYETRRDAILSVVRAELNTLDDEFAPLLEAVQDRISTLEADVKQDVLAHGESVKAGLVHAVYMRGRVSWDTRRLDNYAATHPEVLHFRKQGEPSIAIRAVKDS